MREKIRLKISTCNLFGLKNLGLKMVDMVFSPKYKQPSKALLCASIVSYFSSSPVSAKYLLDFNYNSVIKMYINY